jgi:hypothetical protein
MKPPATIDGARVLEWAWSGEKPFGHVIGGDTAEAIFGLAIATYDKTNTVYRFSCDARWDTVQDGLYSSVDEAKRQLPPQYQNVHVLWHAYGA